MMSRADDWDEPLVRRLIRKHNGKDPELILEEYGVRLLAESGQSSLPINVEGIASLQGIRTRVRAYDFAGRIYAEESGQLVMDLNVTDSDARRRFTAAHELMHTAFPGFTKDARYRVDDFTEGHLRHRAQEEYLCDVGAAALLMPRRLIAGRFSVERGLKAVEDLASKADVSLEAAGNRIVSVDEAPAIFLVLEVMNKPADRRDQLMRPSAEPRLRVKYASGKGLNLFVPRYKSAASGSLLMRALSQTGTMYGVERLPGLPNGPDFSIEAKAYPRTADKRAIARVLALARYRQSVGPNP